MFSLNELVELQFTTSCDSTHLDSSQVASASIFKLSQSELGTTNEGHNTRDECHLCIPLLGFFFGHRPHFVACGQNARFKKDASLLAFYSFRGQ
jgi:hypothetical protein